MKKWFLLFISSFLVLVVGCSESTSDTGTNDQGESQNGETVEIEYWQYHFDSKVKLMDELIAEFEEANPGIKVKQTTFPYDQFNERVAAQVPAGRGPDVINLFYGWVPRYVDSGYLQPLPQDAFSHEEIESEFFPMVESVKIDDEYWTIPTAVRTLALFYNKDLFEEAGLDPEQPPTNWDELVEYSKQLTIRDGNDRLQQAGMAWEPSQQGHHWFRDGLLYQAGGESLSEDRRTILWDQSPAGLEAFNYWLDFPTTHAVGERDFYTDDVTAFMTGHAAMNIDGSFRIGTLQADAPDLNYAIAPLPVKDEQSTQASFWSNGITSGVEGEKLEASVKFLQFLTSEDVMERWLDEIGELPAKESVAMQGKYLESELYGAFIEQLPYANAHFFVDESQERDLVIQAVDRVLLQNVEPEEAFEELVTETQKLFDDYWTNRD
ncbi:extracellular solute-binding protein [Alkalihalobacillus pseudalcaliphilus]|uniref:extracellular solute-binding protein n=1 Tax=Alkalihalobacillus pseudalcaliphilus TaxID=79884 RepID=UPI00064E0383|nr:extracellular solute-binding protein [Alkalihalobacillus pseudalcaliphilus]KMK75581.1 ABC transporter substrate-binding protein [Alkalihalobacillus pseudalcaliphilus]